MSYKIFKVVNYTGHDINDAMSMMTYPSENMKVARCSYNRVPKGKTEDGGIIYETQYTSISGLPEPLEGTRYIVSAPVLNAALQQGREDCIAVNDVIRDGNGNVKGCRGFRMNG